MIEHLLWSYRRWRACHYLWAAEQAYQRWPGPYNQHIVEAATRQLHALEARRP